MRQDYSRNAEGMAMLRAIEQHKAESRRLINDALDKARRAAKLGEPWIFGLNPTGVAACISAFGCRLVKNYEPIELWA